MALDHWHIPDTGLPQHFACDGNGDLVFRTGRGNDSRDITIRSIIDCVEPQLRTPLILRFNDILYSSMTKIHDSFQLAMEKIDYPGGFRDMFQYLYPIKVCFENSVVDTVLRYGEQFGIGIETGSSAEFALAVYKAAERPGQTTVLFDGYKQQADLEFAMDSEQVGCRPVIVIGDLDQLRLTIAFAKDSKWSPCIALRVRLQSSGAGRWAKSCGEHSKFGFSPQDLNVAQDLLERTSMLHTVVMIHFHPGSQVTRIAQIGIAVEQGVNIYIRLRSAGAKNLKSLDCGGGLVIEPQESDQASDRTIDYDAQKYADLVVGTALRCCSAAKIEPPKILIESGRALVAQHAMLVVEVLNVRSGTEMTDRTSEVVDVDLGRRRSQVLAPRSHDAAICGFSIFRSLMDYFIEGRTFHFIPIQRLNEQPKHLVRIEDMSADSDGVIERFPNGKPGLPLHQQNEQRYHLAVPFVGAYQHALGCSHNMLGSVAQVVISSTNEPWAKTSITVMPGSTIEAEIAMHGHVLTEKAILQSYLKRSTYLATPAGNGGQRQTRVHKL
jgi:arginine decarboxylase-like protein